MTTDTWPPGVTGRGCGGGTGEGRGLHILFRRINTTAPQQRTAMRERGPVLAALLIFPEKLEIQLLCAISHVFFFFILETYPLF